MKRISISLATTALVLLLTACGSGLQPANLDRTTAAAFTDMAYSASQYQLTVLQDPVAFEVASVRTLSGTEVPSPVTALLATGGVDPEATTECVVASGVTEDVDGDTIPVDAHYTYDCTTVDSASGVTTRISGTVEVSDQDDADPVAGYMLDMSNLTWSMTTGGETLSFTFDLLVDLVANNGIYEGTFDLSFEMSGPDFDASIGYEFDQKYVANDPADPFIAGTLDFSGNLTLRSNGNLYSLDVNGPDHVVDEACSTGFASGTTSYSDSAGNSLTVDFACDNGTAYFNSTTVDSF